VDISSCRAVTSISYMRVTHTGATKEKITRAKTGEKIVHALGNHNCKS
jgi:hypothetical protein